MKIVRLVCVDGVACRAKGWLYGCNVGLCLLLDEDNGVVRAASLKYLGVEFVVARRPQRLAVVGVAVGRFSIRRTGWKAAGGGDVAADPFVLDPAIIRWGMGAR